MMKKLLIASSVALLALSFQVSAASLPVLTISKQDSSSYDLSRMNIIPPAQSTIQVSSYGQIDKDQTLVHDWGISSDTAGLSIVDFTNMASNDAWITGVGLYSDTTFTNKIATAALQGNGQWILWGVLGVADQVYGLRIEAQGGSNMWSGSYTTNTSPMPIPGAAWLFGSAIAGLVGLGKRRKNAITD